MPAGIEALAHEPSYANVKPVVQPVAETGRGLKLDAVWTSDNYHDIYGFFGAKSASAADASIFAALKPGGVFIVIDHAGLPGSSDTAATTLHRIDPATVKAQVQAAGFVLEAESPLLQNPADPHSDKVFAPSIKGHTASSRVRSPCSRRRIAHGSSAPTMRCGWAWRSSSVMRPRTMAALPGASTLITGPST